MKPFNISGFPRQELQHVWHDVEPLVESGLQRSVGEYFPIDIYEAIAEGKMQLWVASEGIELRGIVVTELINFPRTSVCHVVLVAGSAVENWEHCLDLIEDWALSQGIEYVRAYARIGWKPRAKKHGYDMNYCVYGKFLRAGHENTH